MKAREIAYYFVSKSFSGIARVIHKTRKISKLSKTRNSWICSIFRIRLFEDLKLDKNVASWLINPGRFVFYSVFLLLFGVNAIWSLYTGRFALDSLVETRNFFEDWPNLINYIFLCPIYVTFGLCFIVHVFSLREKLNEKCLLGKDFVERQIAPIYVLGGLAIFVSSFLISFYAAELEKFEWVFWFQSIEGSGVKTLSTPHGFYYLITNFLLNLVVVATVAAHVEYFIVSYNVGKTIQEMDRSSKTISSGLLDVSQLPDLFKSFSALYAVSKIIVVALLFNLYTWRAQQPEFVGMLELSILLLALLGAAVVSYPRYHVQYKLYELWKNNDLDVYPEIRNSLVAGIANVADIVILGGAMTNLVIYVLNKSGVNIKLF